MNFGGGICLVELRQQKFVGRSGVNASVAKHPQSWCASQPCTPSKKLNPLTSTITGALTALKRKKAYEDQISKIMGSRMTLEQQVMAIENANVNLETMNAMRAGAEAMKQIHGNLYVLLWGFFWGVF